MSLARSILDETDVLVDTPPVDGVENAIAMPTLASTRVTDPVDMFDRPRQSWRSAVDSDDAAHVASGKTCGGATHLDTSPSPQLIKEKKKMRGQEKEERQTRPENGSAWRRCHSPTVLPFSPGSVKPHEVGSEEAAHTSRPALLTRRHDEVEASRERKAKCGWESSKDAHWKKVVWSVLVPVAMHHAW